MDHSSDSPRVMVVYGTRPEAIKVAPVIKALESDADLTPIVVITAQHREMLDQVNEVFDIVPDVDLNLMAHGQTLNGIAGRVIVEMDKVLEEHSPDAVLVQGDTTTVMATAIAAFNREIPVVHLEAGLRSGDIDSPFPEEANRKLVSQIAKLHFAPTEVSRANLLTEGVADDLVHVTGNTVIDALKWAVARPVDFSLPQLAELSNDERRVLLVTTHRRENLGENMVNIGKALHALATRYPDLVIVWPAHKNPKVRASIEPEIEGLSNIISIEPVEYGEFSQLIARATVILTDSGGIQEEAPSLGKPVLVLRENTERPEAVDAGTVKLIGTATDRIVSEVSELLDDPAAYKVMANAVNPYGDGLSAGRCVALLKEFLGGAQKQ
ncbi:UDP-N-acetylglucosamine 2-epimerase (non-hydrolysing) [Brevibacterium sanguinis]|uniref:UDP-N-acetylglucosamine 2-epimerase (non-hydrolyzing) n=2 Tax=Brevibacterium TaxID=1696 RepID=A0A366IHD0_9MICO|nr:MULTISPECIES: UDP-N-acetylglucosamine 2-epimerase (non-hydrolyzing) [Brevibacterium]RBP62930.1 UDP-N-acetylglucosamine 2-epimerase (non-hydrolysing) [Brevibacterium sanguinis]RBP69525.1 UDP-N-acetylglucosamine 2-epimerase (non-hydrolysing) [Brevibacterium celere]